MPGLPTSSEMQSCPQLYSAGLLLTPSASLSTSSSWALLDFCSSDTQPHELTAGHLSPEYVDTPTPVPHVSLPAASSPDDAQSDSGTGQTASSGWSVLPSEWPSPRLDGATPTYEQGTGGILPTGRPGELGNALRGEWCRGIPVDGASRWLHSRGLLRTAAAPCRPRFGFPYITLLQALPPPSEREGNISAVFRGVLPHPVCTETVGKMILSGGGAETLQQPERGASLTHAPKDSADENASRSVSSSVYTSCFSMAFILSLFQQLMSMDEEHQRRMRRQQRRQRRREGGLGDELQDGWASVGKWITTSMESLVSCALHGIIVFML
ncbi:hypothetical protein DQ04_05071020 [Trypanosoma grayi]|uniref:hypothetical protein n=1 Tax=Trypanosoma grayi TaxID=71804 RepID=UPI0004F43BE7|nr:hypothetical protein DQ04_05071020 [Trypanosoma grayi]KEG09531.1 hypothetical protein DQ04_05071020 [Trypanosoma grayi]